MSYAAFTKELSDELRALPAQTGTPAATDYTRAERRVFDRWLAQARHEALVRYTVENYDGATGGEDLFRDLGEALVRIGRPDLVLKLYRPIIGRRRGHYFWQRRGCERIALFRIL